MPGQSSPEPGFTLRLSPSPGLATLTFLGWVPLILLTWKLGQGSLMGLPLLLTIVGTAAILSARGGLLIGSTAFAELRLKGGQLLSADGQGIWTEWLPGKNSRLFSRLAWLELTTVNDPRQNRRLILTDLPLLANVPRNDFRRLKVWLRLGASYH